MPSTIFPSSNRPEQPRLSHSYTRATSPQLLLSSITTHETPNHYGRRASSSRQHHYDHNDQAIAHSSSSRNSRNSRNSSSISNPPKLIESSSPSFSSLSHTSTLYSSKNGLVHAVLEAYNNHHNLVLRPDDIWLAILTQLNFSFAKPPSLPPSSSSFSSASSSSSSPSSSPLQPFFNDNNNNIQNNNLKSSSSLPLPAQFIPLLPSFSTTTSTDLTVASIVLLGTATKYLTHSQGTRCGIPAVTLLGTLDDWRELRYKCAEHFGGEGAANACCWGGHVQEWYHCSLKRCVDGFVSSFENPASPEATRFWGTVVLDGDDDGNENGQTINRSGKERYNGWIVGAFCWWDERGRRIGRGGGGGIRWDGLDRGQIPMGFVKVSVGVGRAQMEMVGGSVGVRARGDTVQPEVGWVVYHD